MVGRVVLGCAVVALAACLPKPPPPAPARQAVLGLSVKSVTLGNGLRVVLVEDPHASEVQVTMRYRVGAGEDLANPGMAHLVEHLMFQQTLGAQTLRAQLDDHATYANAFTTHDATTYVSRARPEFLDKLLSIEAVRLGFRCTSITDSAFEREREVVKQEVRLRDDTTELFVALHSAVYPEGHPYRQSIGGTVDSVGAITRQEACAFADSYYATNNAVLVISGKLSVEQVQASLGKFLARIAKRTAASPAPVRVATKWNHAATAPVDEESVLVTWRMPRDPYAQIGVRALAVIAYVAIDSDIKGHIEYVELGDVRAPVFGFAARPGKGETVDEVVKAINDALAMLPTQLGSRGMPSQLFDTLRQHAIYRQYASLEDGIWRDARFAEHALDGRDPAAALADEFRALRNLQREEAASIVTKYLSFSDASVVRLSPSSSKKRGHAIAVTKAVHDMGQRRSVPDAALARQPDLTLPVPSVGIKTRVLPNGLKIVMLPITTVPTVDIRLVFGAGSADEPAAKRGAAALAAYALSFDMRHVNDVLTFAMAGGSMDAEVSRDSTSFIVRGVDMHVDYLLAGLKRKVVDGRYTDWADKLVDAVQRQRKSDDEDGAIADAWSGALYGAKHPYGQPGFMRRVSRNLTVEDAVAFRASYFTPDNATLVIAGHLDEQLTNRWIDHLFTDWQGHAEPRRSSTSALTASSLAKPEDLSQVRLRVALSAKGTRAQQLVAAAMVREIADDVRHQLGATYGFDAELDEGRLATSIVVDGWFDPPRANDVVALLRDRLAKLRDDPDTAARAFVSARRRVIISLTSLVGSASLLAARAERDIELARAPLDDLQTAQSVQSLTIDQMTPILAELELSRAAVLMRGPADPINAAFAALGRQPTILRFDQAAADALDDDPTPTTRVAAKSHEQVVLYDDIEEAITVRGLPDLSPIEVDISAAVMFANLGNLIPPEQTVAVDSGASGVVVAAEVGFRFTNRGSAGLHLGMGTLSGSYARVAVGVEIERFSYGLVPIDIAAYLHMRPLERVTGGFLLGLHFDGTRFDGEREWSKGLGVGLELGYDVIRIRGHRVALMARTVACYGSDIGFGSIGAGLAYRH